MGLQEAVGRTQMQIERLALANKAFKLGKAAVTAAKDSEKTERIRVTRPDRNPNQSNGLQTPYDERVIGNNYACVRGLLVNDRIHIVQLAVRLDEHNVFTYAEVNEAPRSLISYLGREESEAGLENLVSQDKEVVETIGSIAGNFGVDPEAPEFKPFPQKLVDTSQPTIIVAV